MPAADYYKVRGALCSCILSTDFSRHRTFLDAARAHGKALKAARAAAAIEKRKRPLPWNEVRPDLPFLYAADHAHQHRKACATVPEMRGA